MKKITLLFLVFASLSWYGQGQSVINITTSEGGFESEKWVNITTEINGGGTQVWGQGDGTYGNGAGLINQNISLAPGTYYVNCYDRYADSWEGSLISVTSYGTVLNNNGGVSPDDGTNDDATSAFGDTQAQELEASLMIIVPEPLCLLPAVTFELLTECPSGTGFSITVSISDMGMASAVTISDDQSTTPLNVGSTGTYSFGNYTNGTIVVVSVVNDDYAICTVTSDALSFTGECPPANDACSGANEITSFPYNFSQTDASSSTNNDGFITSCSDGMNDGLWFTFTPSTDGNVDIVLSNVDLAFDPQMDLYSGSCGALICEVKVDVGGAGENETIVAQSVTAGTQYFINIGYWSTVTDGAEGNFDIEVTGAFTLSTNEVVNVNAFTYFPNPVKNVLTLNAQSNIQNVSIFNMLGQEVLRTAPNTFASDINMNELQTGAYFVKVTINDTTETIRVIKQ